MFGLIVLGSVVRTTGSGLSCPDWPLCEGRIIPRLQFNVLLEWTHRLVALVVGIGLVATAGWTLARAELHARLGGLALLALALYVTQALLGALTVWKLLDPGVVGGHLATGLLLFASPPGPRGGPRGSAPRDRRAAARATARAAREPGRGDGAHLRPVRDGRHRLHPPRRARLRRLADL
jgi:hypothetical protein